MKTDYKIWCIKRDNSVPKPYPIMTVVVRFYEGNITTKNERNPEGGVMAVTRYRRTKRLGGKVLPHFRLMVRESNGNEAIYFSQKDFGVITTNDELRLYLNGQLAKDKTRTPIDEQK